MLTRRVQHLLAARPGDGHAVRPLGLRLRLGRASASALGRIVGHDQPRPVCSVTDVDAAPVRAGRRAARRRPRLRRRSSSRRRVISPARISSCSVRIACIRVSGPGGQPGAYTSTGHDLIDTLDDGVVVEHAARRCAHAHRDDPLGFHHLVVDLTQHRRHLLRDPTGHDHEVGLAWRRPEDLHAEAGEVVVRATGRHHLDRAAGEPERGGPVAHRARPLHEVLELAGEEVVVEAFEALAQVDRHQAATSRPGSSRPSRPTRLIVLVEASGWRSMRGSIGVQPLQRTPVERAVGDQEHERHEHGDGEHDASPPARTPRATGTRPHTGTGR